MSVLDLGQFRKEVEESLKRLSQKQQVYLTWLCGVRALPFLCNNDKFSYWGEDVQFHLKSIFFAFDISMAIFHGAILPADASRIAHHAACDARYATGTENEAARYVAETASSVANVAADAAYNESTASYAAYTASMNRDIVTAGIVVDPTAVYEDFIASTDFTTIGATAVAIAVVRAAYCIKESLGTDLQKIIFSDIEAIFQNNLSHIDNHIAIYGTLWQDFINELMTVGCGYWADLYTSLFVNDFRIDIESLEIRLNSMNELNAASDAARFITAQYIKKKVNEVKIVIIGEKGAGKTSLARRLRKIGARMPEDYESTEGIDIIPWQLPDQKNGDSVRVHIWDFAGHVITHAAHRFFFSERCIYIIVHDGRTDNSDRIKYWLNYILNYGGGSPIYIIVNKKDPHPTKIRENKLYDDYPDIKNIRHFSIRDDFDALSNFRNELADFIFQTPRLNMKIHPAWYNMREELQKLLVSQKDYITIDEFNKIAENAGVNDNDYEEICKYFHEIGLCLWYDKISRLNNIIINPNWISYGIYKIINWLGKSGEYKLWMKDFPCIFIENEDVVRYPSETYSFLFDMMQSYELAYPIKKHGNTGLVIPFLLPEDQPERGIEKNLLDENCLLMRYKINSRLPPDTIARFIVRHHKDIMIDISGRPFVWKYGVKLKNNQCESQALIIEDDLEIRLYVTGIEAKNYLTSVRDTLNSILENYKNNNVSLEYKITETLEQKPVFANDSTIIVYYKDGRVYLDGTTGKEINMTFVNEMYSVSDGILNKDASHVNTAFKSDKAVIESTINYAPPKELTPEIFSVLLDQLFEFLQSDKTKYELSGKAIESIQDAVKSAQKEKDSKEGWSILRKALSASADVASLLSLFLAAIPTIPSAIVTALTKK